MCVRSVVFGITPLHTHSSTSLVAASWFRWVCRPTVGLRAIGHKLLHAASLAGAILGVNGHRNDGKKLTFGHRKIFDCTEWRKFHKEKRFCIKYSRDWRITLTPILTHWHTLHYGPEHPENRDVSTGPYTCQFACSALLASLERSAALARFFIHSRACGKGSDKMAIFGMVFFLFWSIVRLPIDAFDH